MFLIYWVSWKLDSTLVVVTVLEELSLIAEDLCELLLSLWLLVPFGAAAVS